MRDIGKNIRTLRTEKNMTQDELAEKLFVTRQTVSNYETGRSRPDVEMLARIAEVLETDANTVIYGPPESVNKKHEYFKTTVSVAITIVLALLYSWLGGVTGGLQAYRFIIWPRALLVLFYAPVMMLSMGWTAMQILSLFTKLTPMPRSKTKWLLWGCLIFAGIYCILLSPFLLQSFSPPRFWLYAAYFIMGVWPENFAINWAYLFLPVGSLLWLCGFPVYQINKR